MHKKNWQYQESEYGQAIHPPVKRPKPGGPAVEVDDKGGQADKEKVVCLRKSFATKEYEKTDSEVEECERGAQAVSGLEDMLGFEPNGYAAQAAFTPDSIRPLRARSDQIDEIGVVAHIFDRMPVNGIERVSRADAGSFGRAAGADFFGFQVSIMKPPEDSVRGNSPETSVPEIPDTDSQENSTQDDRSNNSEWYGERIHAKV